MPVSLAQIRDLLLPGLYAVTGEYAASRASGRRSTRPASRTWRSSVLPRCATAASPRSSRKARRPGRQRLRRALHLQPGARRNRPDVRDHPQGDRRQPLQDRVRPERDGPAQCLPRFEEVRGADVINTRRPTTRQSAATARRWLAPTIRWTAARSPTSHRRRSRSTRPRCSMLRSRSTPLPRQRQPAHERQAAPAAHSAAA
jgi:hypothetical protein